MMSASGAWREQVKSLLNHPEHATSPRGMETHEMIGSTVSFDMMKPVVSLPKRQLSFRFMAAEALWILYGSNDLNFHEQIRNKLSPYSDNGETMAGAYGPKVQQQIDYVVNTLENDPDSRQAVMTIWERNPAPSKDIPCTLSLQFMIRNEQLYTNVCMRSSDVWMGLPYDMFTFTAITALVRLKLNMNLDQRECNIFAGSSHLYQKNFAEAYNVIGTVSYAGIGWLTEIQDTPGLFHFLSEAAKAETEAKAYALLTS